MARLSCSDPYVKASLRCQRETRTGVGESWTGFNSFLTGVSCPSATVRIAVGSSFRPASTQTLAERWTGTSWTIQATPNPAAATSSALTGASCPSDTACTAVGNYANSGGPGLPLAERYS